MYSNKFITSIKSNGSILREKGNTVKLPFGSEYSLFFKNLETRKAVIRVSIDGCDVLGGHSLVVFPNSTLELERYFMADNKGNRFKFIKKTEQMSKYRGDRLDDGFIRVEFTFEQHVAKPITIYPPYIYYPPSVPWISTSSWRKGSPYYTDNTLNPRFCTSSYSNKLENSVTESSVNSAFSTANSACASNTVTLEDQGLTVPGGISDQKFQEVSTGPLEDISYSMILRLSGYETEAHEVKKPLTVSQKLICPTCGLVSRSDAQFCRRCGTCLVRD